MKNLKVGQEFEVENGKLVITKVKQPTIAISPISNYYITKGKEYDITSIEEGSEYYGHLFTIIDDAGYSIISNEKNSNHINGLNWELK